MLTIFIVFFFCILLFSKFVCLRSLNLNKSKIEQNTFILFHMLYCQLCVKLLWWLNLILICLLKITMYEINFIDNFLFCSESYAKIWNLKFSKTHYTRSDFFFSFRYKTFIFYFIYCIYICEPALKLRRARVDFRRTCTFPLHFFLYKYDLDLKWLVFFIKYYVCIQWNRFNSIIENLLKQIHCTEFCSSKSSNDTWY